MKDLKDPFSYFSDELRAGKQMCLMPVSRIHVEEPTELKRGMVLYPGYYLTPTPLRVVSWPRQDSEELSRKHGVDIGDGWRSVALHGPELAWFKSATTGIELVTFFESALVAIAVEIDWDLFLAPPSHEHHLRMISSTADVAEETFDLIRLHYCHPLARGTLPGRVSYLSAAGFSCALFYTLLDHESYVVAGETLTHAIVSGIGLDLTTFSGVPEIGNGELGQISRHGLRMLSSAMEANSETSKFVQMLSLLEYLAEPDHYISMANTKRRIGRHVARSRAEYDFVMNDFQYLTSEPRAKDTNTGLRHNIVHLGRRIEDLIGTEERAKVFKRLWRYVAMPLGDMIELSDANWGEIEKLRHASGARLGLNNKG
jgi:hypothetical protein